MVLFYVRCGFNALGSCETKECGLLTSIYFLYFHLNQYVNNLLITLYSNRVVYPCTCVFMLRVGKVLENKNKYVHDSKYRPDQHTPYCPTCPMSMTNLPRHGARWVKKVCPLKRICAVSSLG